MIIVRNRMRPRLALALVLALCAAALPLSAKQHKIPKPKNASAYPCHDEHASVVVAAEPYNTTEQGKLFRVPYLKNGFLPIYLVVTNNSDEAISLDQARIDFISAERDRITAAVPGDVERRMTHLHGSGAQHAGGIFLLRRAGAGANSAEGGAHGGARHPHGQRKRALHVRDSIRQVSVGLAVQAYRSAWRLALVVELRSSRHQGSLIAPDQRESHHQGAKRMRLDGQSYST